MGEGLIKEQEGVSRPKVDRLERDEDMVPEYFWGGCEELEKGKGLTSVSHMPHVHLFKMKYE